MTTTVGYEYLTIERKGYIATITLNRPDRMNALNKELTREFHEVLDEVDLEFPDIRVVIITGAGRGFCAGADVLGQAQTLQQNEEKPASPPAPSDPVSLGKVPYTNIPTLAEHIRKIAQPVIAAVNGVAVGAGISISLASDIRIASEAARFSEIFVKRSLVPDTGSAYTLSSAVGRGIAMEMALTGRIYDASWALEKHLVNKVVSAEDLMTEAETVAEEIANNPPLCVREIKQLMYSFDPSMEQILTHEHMANGPSFGSQDRKESVMSFVEKRDPVFLGR
tara:strand:- start:720 stop:1559 length:840 start_codon:yes stop_codon:yes gene_type:complete